MLIWIPLSWGDNACSSPSENSDVLLALNSFKVLNKYTVLFTFDLLIAFVVTETRLDS